MAARCARETRPGVRGPGELPEFPRSRPGQPWRRLLGYQSRTFAKGEVALRSEARVHTTAKPGNTGLNRRWHGTHRVVLQQRNVELVVCRETAARANDCRTGGAISRVRRNSAVLPGWPFRARPGTHAHRPSP